MFLTLKMTQEMDIEMGMLISIPGCAGEWYVHCKHCENPNSMVQIQARDEAHAKLQLEEEKHWRLSMKGRPSILRFWACPTCAEFYEDKKTTTVRAEPA